MDRAELDTKVLGRNFYRFDRLPSTNGYLKENADKCENGTLVIAATQTEGRGRLGRAWSDIKGKSLLMSVLLVLERGVDASALPLVCGLAAYEALRSLRVPDLGLKWPNDVVSGRRKLCGILCESTPVSAGVAYVCGFGVNVLETAGELRLQGLEYATSIFAQTKEQPEPDLVAALILNELEPLIDQYLKYGFSVLRERYKERCVNLGADIRAYKNRHPVEGQGVDILKSGALMIVQNGTYEQLDAGDASIVGFYGE